jgi:hypothetical protein
MTEPYFFSLKAQAGCQPRLNEHPPWIAALEKMNTGCLGGKDSLIEAVNKNICCGA